MILKDKFLSQCASDIRKKLQQLQQQDPAACLDEMVHTATNTFYNGEQEREKRKETGHAKMLSTMQGSPMANPESLRDKGGGKCLICRQVGHWAKECPTHDKSPKTTSYSSVQFSSVAQSCPTLQPHELQNARPPCPSPIPRVHSNSHPLSR